MALSKYKYIIKMSKLFQNMRLLCIYIPKKNVGLALIAFPIQPYEYQSYFRGSSTIDTREPFLPMIASTKGRRGSFVFEIHLTRDVF